MSASVVDAITLERRGIPAAVIGVDKLVNTTGQAMATVQGAKDYPFAVISSELSSSGLSSSDSVSSDEEIEVMAKSIIPQVESILTN